jgi:hypothetical protein
MPNGPEGGGTGRQVGALRPSSPDALQHNRKREEKWALDDSPRSGWRSARDPDLQRRGARHERLCNPPGFHHGPDRNAGTRRLNRLALFSRRVLEKSYMTASSAPALVLALVMALAQGCAATPAPVVAAAPPAPDSGGVLPSQCEKQRSDGLYEMLVPSVIERLGTRYVLTVACDGVHRIYLKPSASIDFAPFVGQRVCARYRYVEQIISPTPCVRAPCGDAIEKILDIADVWATPPAGCPTP